MAPRMLWADEGEPLRGRSVIVISAAGRTHGRARSRTGRERESAVHRSARPRPRTRAHDHDLFNQGQHAEAGADLIEVSECHPRLRAVGVSTEAGPHPEGQLHLLRPGRIAATRIWRTPGPWTEAVQRLQGRSRDLQGGRELDCGVARALGPISVAQWLKHVRADHSFSVGVSRDAPLLSRRS